mmetsp:Transcript_8741/g.36178  ORF Transcript_8741/g.36178 Transcript_8741/m.36178 type:complete len:230 (-) Transcript_8741:1470-2159(-)
MTTISFCRSPWWSPCQSGWIASSRPSGHSARSSVAHQSEPGSSVAVRPASERMHWCSRPRGVARYAMPLARRMVSSSSHASRTARRRRGCSASTRRNTNDEMPYSSVSGVCSSVRASLSHIGCASARCRAKLPVLRMRSRGTTPRTARTTVACGFIDRTVRSTVSTSSTRSHLFRTMTSANSIWSTSRCAMVRSTSNSCAAQPRSASRSTARNSVAKVEPSTTVTIVSS